METFSVAGTSIDMGEAPIGIEQHSLHDGVVGAMMALTDFHDARTAIEADRHLSTFGRGEKLEPLREKVWAALASISSLRASVQKETDQRESALLAAPKLAPGASAVAVEDAEVRSWWRGLSHAERAEIFRALESDALGQGFERYGRLWLALLRSPIPLPDRDLDVARSLWERDRRNGNPAEAAYVERQRAALAWFDRGFAHLRAHATRLTGWDRQKLAQWLASDAGRAEHAGAFGFSARDMAHATAMTRKAA